LSAPERALKCAIARKGDGPFCQLWLERRQRYRVGHEAKTADAFCRFIELGAEDSDAKGWLNVYGA